MENRFNLYIDMLEATTYSMSSLKRHHDALKGLYELNRIVDFINLCNAYTGLYHNILYNFISSEDIETKISYINKFVSRLIFELRMLCYNCETILNEYKIDGFTINDICRRYDTCLTIKVINK